MWPKNYFAANYFPQNYWPEDPNAGGVIAAVSDWVRTNLFFWDRR
jgi:hypothetical protein